jgi:hypothetical protein
MTHRLEIVAVRIENERTIVICVILRAQARRPVALSACSQSSATEAANRTTVFSCERDGDGSSTAAGQLLRLYLSHHAQ